MTLTLPNAFASLQTNNTNFEMSTSSIIQPARLQYKRNFATRANAIIFVSTECKGVLYPDAIQRSEIVSKLWAEVF